MPVLLLALDIAETIEKAREEFDYAAKAAELLAAHPEASVDHDAVVKALQSEFSAPRRKVVSPPLPC
jgi:hypothetical protein